MRKEGKQGEVMYRLTIYNNNGEKDVDEFKDEDFLRHAIDIAIGKIEMQSIKTFSVSWIKSNSQDKAPWWEK